MLQLRRRISSIQYPSPLFRTRRMIFLLNEDLGSALELEVVLLLDVASSWPRLGVGMELPAASNMSAPLPVTIVSPNFSRAAPDNTEGCLRVLRFSNLLMLSKFGSECDCAYWTGPVYCSGDWLLLVSWRNCELTELCNKHFRGHSRHVFYYRHVQEKM